jgi:hypothetical protein
MFDLKAKVAGAAKELACIAVATGAGIVALFFLCFALFIWLRETYGTITACLVLAGVFVILAATTFVVGWMSRKRSLENLEHRQRASPQWWTDPVVISTVLAVVRALGARRVAMPLVIGGILGSLINNPSRRAKSSNGAKYDQAHSPD